MPTFPAADFWYLEFYDLRNMLLYISSYSSDSISNKILGHFCPSSHVVYVDKIMFGHLDIFLDALPFLNRRDVLSNDLFVQIVRLILPIMISIYFHINNSTNMIMDEWDLTFMISLVQFHSKTSSGPSIIRNDSFYSLIVCRSVLRTLVCLWNGDYLMLTFDDDVLKFIGV